MKKNKKVENSGVETLEIIDATNKIMKVLRQKNINIAHTGKRTNDIQIKEIEMIDLFVNLIINPSADSVFAQSRFKTALEGLKEARKNYKIKLFGEKEAKKLFPRYFKMEVTE